MEQTPNAMGGGQSNPIATAVFWQSCWYLFLFYLTWVPYVALQFMWSAGSGYSTYGLVVLACTLVPLQGFFNGIVYFHHKLHRQLGAVTHIISSRLSLGARPGETDVAEEAPNNEAI